MSDTAKLEITRCTGDDQLRVYLNDNRIFGNQPTGECPFLLIEQVPVKLILEALEK